MHPVEGCLVEPHPIAVGLHILITKNRLDPVKFNQAFLDSLHRFGFLGRGEVQMGSHLETSFPKRCSQVNVDFSDVWAFAPNLQTAYKQRTENHRRWLSDGFVGKNCLGIAI